MHFYDKYIDFLAGNNISHNEKLCQQAFYPILIREFFKIQIEPSLYVPYLENIEKFLPDGPITHKQLYFNFSALLIAKNAMNVTEFKKEEAVERMKTDLKGIEVTQKLLELLKYSDFSSVQSSQGDQLNDADGFARIKNEADLISMLTDDFFGLLKGKSDEEKKNGILKIYNYFYRFALVKMQTFVDDPILMLFTL